MTIFVTINLNVAKTRFFGRGACAEYIHCVQHKLRDVLPQNDTQEVLDYHPFTFRLRRNTKNRIFVILNEVKNLLFVVLDSQSILKQVQHRAGNDIAEQSVIPACSPLKASEDKL